MPRIKSSPNGNCPPKGSWPGPDGPHYLNRLNDGSCGYYVSQNSFSSLVMDSGTFYMEADVSVNDGGTVTIQPGVTLLDENAGNSQNANGGNLNIYGTLTVGSGASMQFAGGPWDIHVLYTNNTNGTLNMNGTSKSGITVTSDATNPTPGAWGGINFADSATGTWNYVHVSYAGATMNTYCGNINAAIAIGKASPTISYTRIDNSSGNDIEVCHGALPALHNDSFLAVPSGKFGVVNDGWSNGQPMIDATSSWWGDPSGPYNKNANPSGKGTPVSDGVSFSPWLTKAPPYL